VHVGVQGRLHRPGRRWSTRTPTCTARTRTGSCPPGTGCRRCSGISSSSTSLRGATALFGHLGIEADITQVGADDLAELAGWIEFYERHRALIHSGRVARIDTPDDTAWMHGVVAADRSAALMSYVQLDEPLSDQPAALRVPGLDPRRRYQLTDVTPGARRPRRVGLAEPGLPGLQVSGAALAEIGLAIAPRRTLTATVILVEGL